MLPWNGRAYQVAVRDLDIEGVFSVWAQEQAWLAVMRMEKKVPPYVTQAAIKHLSEVQSFVYEWGGRGCHAARCSEQGMKKMLHLQMVKLDKSITPALVDELAKDPAAHVLMERFVLGDLDPNPPAPTSGEQPSP